VRLNADFILAIEGEIRKITAAKTTGFALGSPKNKKKTKKTVILRLRNYTKSS
jgi:hypothetical protein